MMLKMSIAQAAQHFGVSKEAIHNRVRRGSLNSVVEDGIKLVVIDENSNTKQNSRKNVSTLKSKMQNTSDERYYKLLEEQNLKLQNRVEKLEDETRTLRDQKEQMLIEERIKIEQIYKDKDEQLKNILNALSSKFMLTAPQEDIEHLEAEIEAEEEILEESQEISFKKYLKSLNYSKKKIDKLLKKVKKISKKDSRIVTIGRKFYINPKKYDYSDIL